MEVCASAEEQMRVPGCSAWWLSAKWGGEECTSKGMLRTARRHPRRNLPSGLCSSMNPFPSPAFVLSISGPQQASHVLRRSSGLSISCGRSPKLMQHIEQSGH